MSKSGDAKFLRITKDAQSRLIAAARHAAPVRGLTHGYYKYPARFSPIFVRTAIELFTKPGDLVLDPHVGGGTTLVEALATGRDGIGVDVSTLAEFVATVKCTIYSEAELERLEKWAKHATSAIDIKRRSIPIPEYAEQGYYKHLNHRSRWRLRKSIEQSLASAVRLGRPRLESFGRCAILRTAQWALDGRKRSTSVDEFRRCLQLTVVQMIQGARDLRAAVKEGRRRPSVKVLRRSAAGIENDKRLARVSTPRLVVTSPPYPGVHVLYHRWQVDGRKEAPLPFLIANKLDGVGSSHYTMGDRKCPELKTYFQNIRASMSSVAAVADDQTIIVQMLAFSEPDWQLPRYLEAMEEAGLEEYKLAELNGQQDGRLWRRVPNRRWYNEQRGNTPSSSEVVLIHRRRASINKATRPSVISSAASNRVAQ